MVTAGILGGIASRNAALPHLAITQICLGAVSIGLGSLLLPRAGSLILMVPLVVYIVAMISIVLSPTCHTACARSTKTTR